MGRDVLHGHYLTELFGGSKTTVNVFERFVRSIIEAMGVIHFNTPLLKNYHDNLMLILTKDRFQTMLKHIGCMFLLILLEHGLRQPSAHRNIPLSIGPCCLLLLLIYLSTLQSYAHHVYCKLSFLVIVGTLVLTFGLRAATLVEEQGLHSPGIVVIICICVFSPLRTEMCFTVSFMYIAASVGLEMFHSSITYSTISSSMVEDADNDQNLVLRVHAHNHTAGDDEKSLALCRIIGWIPIMFIGLYLRFWNTIRHYFAFFKLGASVQARRECEAALEGQVRWIEAIMPSVIRVEYQAQRQQQQENKLYASDQMWVFNKRYENVSIMFADIVGFTRMSSNKTAHKVVTMLNNLFNRFDELCVETKCEKLGTLGDCYYCISGCPIPQSNHAVSCIEMGLGMCRIIKKFNHDFNEAVGMRIGVHTGCVNAAIIGSIRYRFDVYSYDVIIASMLESSGRPGRVHISQTTFDLVRSIYNCSKGEPIDVKQEEVSGIAGMVLVNRCMETYFVDPRSTQWRKKHERYGQGQSELHAVVDHPLVGRRKSFVFSDTDLSSLEALDTKRSIPDSAMYPEDTPWSLADEPGEYQSDVLQEFERDMQLINNLQKDSEKHYLLFHNLPLWPILLKFVDAETEWHYHAQINDSTRKTYVDSQKIAPVADVLACFVLLSFASLTIYLIALDTASINMMHIVINLGAIITVGFAGGLLIFAATTYGDQIDKVHISRLYHLIIHPVFHEFCLAVLTLMPGMTVFVIMRMMMSDQSVVLKNQLISLVIMQCMLGHALPLSSASWVRALCAFVTYLQFILGLPCKGSEEERSYCMRLVNLTQNKTSDLFCSVFIIELTLCLILIIRVTRENERHCRLCFYVSREAEIIGGDAKTAVDDAEAMLYNIIPKYVLEQLTMWNHDPTTTASKSFNYAVSVPNAAVAFATISNFFSGYYREDYKGGENALKLLNSIFTIFDSLLDQPEMKDVEKIKTMNDSYMVATGLNREEIRRNRSALMHLIALMQYCHMLIEQLEEFNDAYIIGTNRFEIKIGFNSGPLIAGIIGTTKPMYDVWGNTVNVASRMYSTGIVGKVQVPEQVAEELDEYFDFVYRGDVFVKGKGEMHTFLCEKKIEQ